MDIKSRNQILREMEDSVGTKDPLVYFKNLTQVLKLLFDQIDELSEQNVMLKTMAALAIKWEPVIARDMIDNEIACLREDRDIYHVEISALKKARMEDSVTQNYESFCKFWEDTLGYHPFLDYK